MRGAWLAVAALAAAAGVSHDGAAARASAALAEPASWSEQGAELFRSGKLTRAAEVFEEAAPELDAILNAAVLYRELGEHDKALGSFERAVRLAPRDPFVQASYGWAALRAGRPSEAEAAFRLALELEPGERQALLGRGRVLLEGRHVEEAIGALSELTAGSPDFTLGWLYLARAYEQAGRDADAVEAYRKAYQSDSTFSELRLALGAVYRKLKNFNEAFRQYALLLALDPSHAAASRHRRELAALVQGDAQDVPAVAVETGALVPAAGSSRMPTLRVGVGTSVSGRPELRKAVVFRCTGPFRVVDPPTGRTLVDGPAEERYVVRRGRDGRFEAVDSKQSVLLRFSRVVAVEPLEPRTHSLVFQEVRIASGFSWSSVRDRQLKGRVELRARGAKLHLVNELGLEDYLYGVVTEEMPTRFPTEALKAQAVIARTHTVFAAKYLKPHRRYGYDLCDGQHCQVYGGVSGESDEARRASDETRGQVLRYAGRLAQTPYASNCGGRSQDSGELSGWTRLPYLSGRVDGDEAPNDPLTPWRLERWVKDQPKVYCRMVPDMPAARFRWTRAVPAKELEARANRERRIGRVKRVVVVRRSRAGFANEVWVEGDRGRLKLDREHLIRRTLGIGSLRSTLFVVETDRDAGGRPVEFVFHGGGWGHGVGLCQFGAAGRALQQQTYKHILGHYYPGTDLATLDY